MKNKKKKDFVKLKEPLKGKGKYYLTNKDLLPAIIEAKKKGVFTDKLARQLMLLTDNYSRKSSFGGYSYREDMVSEALLNLCKNWAKFDETKYDNPFAFYTTAIRHSFLQYMNNETKQRFVRDTLLVDNGLDPSFGYNGYLNEKEKKKAEDKHEEDKTTAKEKELNLNQKDIENIKNGKVKITNNGILEF